MQLFRSMRILYFLVKYPLNYSLRVYFRRVRVVNRPKKAFDRTIYVSNHPASFMDPLIIGSFIKSIVFFLTRSDVFTKVSSPFLWAFHMLPIYREQDGVDTKEKNRITFDKCTRILQGKRNLLIFGEGFTDDIFIRRLKPIKKGAARIGFQTLEAINWSEKIYMAAVGCNYTAPNKIGSELVISVSDKICLNDYKELYEENPTKVIHDITKLIEGWMQDQITYVKDKNLAPFHEQVMSITRKGINPDNYDKEIELLERWEYSRKLAHWLNKRTDEEIKAFEGLRQEMDAYFIELAKLKLSDSLMYWKEHHANKGVIQEILYLILLFPIMLLGIIHFALPYLLIKRFVERSFKRKVFWGSVKLIMGMIAFGLYNIPAIFLFYYCIYPSWWLGITYYVSIGLIGLGAYQWFRHLNTLKAKKRAASIDLHEMTEKRRLFEMKIKELIPELH